MTKIYALLALFCLINISHSINDTTTEGNGLVTDPTTTLASNTPETTTLDLSKHWNKYQNKAYDKNCDVCVTWNSALTSRKRRAPGPMPRRGGGSKGSSSKYSSSSSKYSSSSSKYSSSKYSSSGSSYKPIVRITTAYLTASTGKKILSNSKWIKPKQPSSWSDSEFQDWEEEAMAYFAYIDDNGICKCGAKVFGLNLVLIVSFFIFLLE